MRFRAFFVIATITSLSLNTSAAAAPIRGLYDQRVDPSNPTDKRTFRQRFIIDSTNASGPDAPVVYFLGNEANLDLLIESAGYVKVMARELHAHFVALEHRYYGESVIADTLTADTMKYLSIANALSDFARFQEYARQQFGLRGKWIAVGRSYGASLATYYRELYPDHVVGAVAAAPALFWKKEWNEFDARLAQLAGPACVTRYHETILAPLETAWSRHESLAQAKSVFHATDVKDDGDFLYALGETVSFLLQMKGPAALCPLLARPDALSAVAATLVAFMHEEKLSGLVDFAEQGAMSLKAADYARGIGMRQWTYQTCAELGMVGQGKLTDAKATFQSILLSKRMADDQVCRRVLNMRARSLDDIERLNRRYYEPLLGAQSKVTNVLVLNDAADPTATLSISDENKNHTNSHIIVYSVAGSAHHEELNAPSAADPPSWIAARSFILKTMSSWL